MNTATEIEMPSRSELWINITGETLKFFWEMLTTWPTGIFVAIVLMFAIKDVLRLMFNLFLRIASSGIREHF